jgi:hypothetical protein
MSKLNLIQDLAKKYEVESVTKRIKDVLDDPSISIGFIGEFSSGKTSLINSMLGLALPTSIKPTTKSICLIKPTTDLEKNQFFIEDNGIEKPVDRFEFEQILKGDKYGVATIKVKPSKVLPSGCIFVDTPGVSSIDESANKEAKEVELTYGYLSLVDAAILCININEGTINKKVQDFLCRPELKPIHNHLIVALTFSDQKSENERKIVKENIINQLEKLSKEGLFFADNIKNKVFEISNQNQNNAETVYNFLKETVLEQLPQLIENKKEKEFEKIAMDLKNILKDKKETLQYNSEEIEEQINKIKKDKTKIEEDLYERKDKISNLKNKIENSIFAELNNYKDDITKEQSDEERLQAINNMNKGLVDRLSVEMQKYSKTFTLSEGTVKLLYSDLIGRLKNIERWKDVSVTVATAAATAWIGGATTVAGNAGEAAGGALAQKGATTLSKTAKAAEKGATTLSKLGKGLTVVAKIIKEVNPLEHVGTAIASQVKYSSFDNILKEKVSIMAESICNQLDETYYHEIIKPLKLALDEKVKMLEELKSKGDEHFDKFLQYKKDIDADISSLN